MMTNVIILTDWFYPAYKAGGPITSLYNLTQTLKEKLNINIFTSAYDLGETKVLDNIKPDIWEDADGIRIKYMTEAKVAASEVENGHYTILYLNSMFSLSFTLKPLWRVKRNNKFEKIILAPRGMLAEGALSIKSLKKRSFLYLFKLSGIHKKILFHATSEQEVGDIRKIFGNNVKVKFIPNMPSKPDNEFVPGTKEPGSLRLITVSRIAPEKNILFLLKLLSNFKTELTLDIYGMIKTQEYLEECNKIISSLPDNVLVNIRGGISPDLIKDKLKEAHFFILPTLGENFGHAIYEALGSGRPVIISNKTPWRNLEEKIAGWDISLDNPDMFIEVIKKCVLMDQEEYNKWTQGAYLYAKKYYEENDPTKEYLEMFGYKG